jgi:hypothetical protein
MFSYVVTVFLSFLPIFCTSTADCFVVSIDRTISFHILYAYAGTTLS